MGGNGNGEINTESLVVRLEFFFFFLKQKTAYDVATGDWSSNVCSSDLPESRTVLLVALPESCTVLLVTLPGSRTVLIVFLSSSNDVQACYVDFTVTVLMGI